MSKKQLVVLLSQEKKKENRKTNLILEKKLTLLSRNFKESYEALDNLAVAIINMPLIDALIYFNATLLKYKLNNG